MTTHTKHNSYKNQAHYENSSWVDDTRLSNRSDNGMGCLIVTVIICAILIGAVVYSFGLV